MGRKARPSPTRPARGEGKERAATPQQPGIVYAIALDLHHLPVDVPGNREKVSAELALSQFAPRVNVSIGDGFARERANGLVTCTRAVWRRSRSGRWRCIW